MELRKKRRPGQFVKGDPRIVPHPGPHPGAGRPSELHRAECRRLVEEHKIRDFFSDVSKGQKVDFHVTLGGKVVNVPANIRNRLIAGITLIEHGYGKAPQEIRHSISDAALEKFERLLSTALTNYFPKMCPHCRTAIKMPVELVEEMLKLSRIFEEDEEPADASRNALPA
jgi:methyl coenzyme M reductase subunit C-like uncharacterized protein (methanogenesis marker protein 7)